MGLSKISWTDYTFNPWRGCAKVSPACANCYAESRARRFDSATVEWGVGGKRVIAAESTWKQPLAWNAKAKIDGTRPKVFCASLADVFEDREDLIEPRARYFETIRATPNLIHLLLTKRIDKVLNLVPESWKGKPGGRYAFGDYPPGWPKNVWIGTTVEDERRAGERIPALLEIPAPVRFLSCEPLLEEIMLRLSWRDYLQGWDTVSEPAHGCGGDEERCRRECPVEEPVQVQTRKIDWIIAGDETGHGKRPTDPNWLRSLRDQAVSARVPFHLKQFAGGRTLDGREWNEAPTVALEG